MSDSLLPLKDAWLTDALPGRIAPTARGDYVSTALNDAVAGMRPGWIVLQDCPLEPDDAAPAARIRYALLHQQVGIALLDLVPGSTTPNAAERLGRMLGAAGFTARFGGTPPIIYLCMPTRTLPSLDWVLEQEFGRQPPLALSGGGAWIGAAQRVLAAERPSPLPERASGDDGKGSRHPPPATPPGAAGRRRRSPGLHLLAGGCGLLALMLGGTAVLHDRGLPEGPAITAAGDHAADGPDRVASPNAASMASDAPAMGEPVTGDLPPPPAALPDLMEPAPASPAATMPQSDLLAGTTGDTGDNGSHAPIEAAPPQEEHGSVFSAVAAEALDSPSVPPVDTAAPAPSDDAGVEVASIAAPTVPSPSDSRFPENGGEESIQNQADTTAPSGSDLPGLPAEESAAPPPPSSDLPAPTVAAPPPRSDAVEVEPASTPTPASAVATPSGDTGPVEAEAPTAAPGTAGEDAASIAAEDAGAPPDTAPVQAATAPESEAVSPDNPPRAGTDGEGDSRASAAEADADGAGEGKTVLAVEDTGTAASPETVGSPATTSPTPHEAPVAPAASDQAPPGATAPPPDRQAEAVAPSAGEPQARPTLRSLPRSTLETFIRRGDEMVRLGDISAARLLYGRAAAAGSGQAAIAMGRTYDPAFLATIHARGIQGDTAVAVSWYRRALELGMVEIRERLAELSTGQDQ